MILHMMLYLQVSCTLSMNDYGGEGNHIRNRMLNFCASANFPTLNACDGMSDIAFYFPAMLVRVRDDDFISRCLSTIN